MHKLACELRSRHIVQVVTQWNTQRTDWLWGTTIRAPKPAHAYVIDDIPVNRITLSQKSRWRLLPWVLAYYPLQHWALPQIANALVDELMPLALNADIVHNCRAGREGRHARLGLRHGSRAPPRHRGGAGPDQARRLNSRALLLSLSLPPGGCGNCSNPSGKTDSHQLGRGGTKGVRHWHGTCSFSRS